MRFGCRIGLNTEDYAFPAAFHGMRSMRHLINFTMAVPRFTLFDFGKGPNNSLGSGIDLRLLRALVCAADAFFCQRAVR